MQMCKYMEQGFSYLQGAILAHTLDSTIWAAVRGQVRKLEVF